MKKDAPSHTGISLIVVLTGWRGWLARRLPRLGWLIAAEMAAQLAAELEQELGIELGRRGIKIDGERLLARRSHHFTTRGLRGLPGEEAAPQFSGQAACSAQVDLHFHAKNARDMAYRHSPKLMHKIGVWLTDEKTLLERVGEEISRQVEKELWVRLPVFVLNRLRENSLLPRAVFLRIGDSGFRSVFPYEETPPSVAAVAPTDETPSAA